MENGSFNQVKSNAEKGGDWDMKGVEFAGNRAAETVERHLDEMDEAYHEYMGEKEAEVVKAEAGTDVTDGGVKVETTSVETGAVDAGEKKGEWTAFVKGTAEADKLGKDESLLLFLTSADGGYAVKKTEAIDTFIDGVKKAENGKDFWEAQRLGLTIQSDKGKFADEDVKKMTEFMQTPAYQKKLYSYNVEQSKKIIEKKNGDLQRCMDEVAREKKGGFFKRLVNRRAIKEAEGRADMVRKGIKEAEESLVLYAGKLKELEGDGGVSAEVPMEGREGAMDAGAKVESSVAGKNEEKFDADAFVEEIMKEKEDDVLDTDALVESLINPGGESKAA